MDARSSNLETKNGRTKQNVSFRESCALTLLLSPCSWVILITSGLWLTQVNPLKAMDPPENPVKEILYKDTNHPLTQEFWKEKDLSERLKKLKVEIDQRKQEIFNYKTNSINITDEEKEKYKDILKCIQCETNVVSNLKKIHLDNLFTCNRSPYQPDSGWSSGTEVIIIKENSKNLIAIKKFTDIKKGLEELFYSLIALEINPAPHKLKMARIYDAIICPKDSLSIIMEAANTTNIHHLLSGASAINAVKACAKYLAIFHIENHHKLNKSADGKKHLLHVSQFFHSLKEDTLEEQHKIFKLLSLTPREKISDVEFVRSDNIVSLLSEEEQEKFENLVKISCNLIKKNTEKTFRALSNNIKQQKSYFLTITHGDAHAHNFFYDNSQLKQDGTDIHPDSSQRISMIDFASIIKTYGSIGDPAEDVGRFLAALWNWCAIENESDHREEEVLNWQNKFIKHYLETIKNSGIIEEDCQESFKKRFKENCSFYKLRYYRAIFNVKKDDNLEKDEKIKRKLLESWINENAGLESSAQKEPKKIIQREKERRRFWQSVCDNQKDIIHWLPDRSNEFIEATAEGEKNSYLTCLWKTLEDTGNVALSSTAAIAGMGGIGKTSLALEYAHEALKNNAYNLIYWIHSGNESSLIKSYRELLLNIIDPNLPSSIKYETNERVVSQIKQYIPKIGKCLLIYDNVPDSDFLKDKVPENTHILMTSRCNQGWERPPLILDVFSTEDSIRYFLKIAGIKQANAGNDVTRVVKQLAEELDHFPLALSHAAHYIKLVGGGKVSKKHFKDYLEAFKKEGLENFEENRNSLTEAHSKITYENLIAKTLNISTQYISRVATNSTRAKEIMEFCAYLSPDVIMEDIFLEYCQNREEMEKILDLLSGLSFLKKVKGEGKFSIHRLVQLVLRNKKELETNPQSQYEEIFSKIVPVFHKLFEHNISTEEQVSKSLDNLQHIISLLENSMRLKISSDSLEYLQWIGWLIEGIESINLATQYQVSVQNMLSNPLFFQKRILESFLGDSLKSESNSSNLLNIIDMFNGEKPRKALQLFELISNGSNPIPFDDIIENRECMENILARIMEVSGVPKNKIKHLAKSFIQERLLFDHLKRHNAVPQKIIQIVEKGHSSLQAALGTLYWRHKDMGEAFYWFDKAAEGGHKEAHFYLGKAHQDGEGTQKDINEAIRYYAMAAEKGHIGAQYNLGSIYAKNESVQLYYDLAIKYLTEAANQGHSQAQLKLGALYAKNRDINQAILWLERAAKNGSTEAAPTLALLYKTNEDHSKSFEWFTIAAKQGDIEAQYHLGRAHQDGEGTQKDINEAIRYYAMAAEKGHIGAQFTLGLLYRKEGDIDQAIFWLERAAKNGSTRPPRMLAVLYETKDHSKSFEWFTIAAKQGDIEAQYRLGRAYEYGKGTSKNIGEAIQWYTIAAVQGHISAINTIQQIPENFSQDENKYTLQGVSYIYEAVEHFKTGDTDLAEYFMKEARNMFDLAENDIQLNLMMKNSNESISQKQLLSKPAAEIEKHTSEVEAEGRDTYLSKGNHFLELASKYAEEGNEDLAEHFAKKASKQFAKNAQL